MNIFYNALLVGICMTLCTSLYAQKTVKGKIIDLVSKEPVAGATVHCTKQGCNCICTSNISGEFEMNCKDCDKLSISSIGYVTEQVFIADKPYFIALVPSPSKLQEVVVTANRGASVKRSEVPVAIALISYGTLQDAKPISADQVLNKISGVNMVSLGNEQHQMSIRQPMTTKSLFLYLEDGVPIRTTGLYNHNALLEMNMAITRNIEVIKGPSSSLYGSEAIGGVVNFITAAPSVKPQLKLSVQANNIGYKRTELFSTAKTGKWGFVTGGYYSNKNNENHLHNDFHKAVITTRIDHNFSDKTILVNKLTWLDYYTDMPGTVDSNMFAAKVFSSPFCFTYRDVKAFRYTSTLSQKWNESTNSNISALYRSNAIGQNPAYRVKDDYRKVNGIYTGKKDLAHGEINQNTFHSYSIVMQHSQKIDWKNTEVFVGLSTDLSPSNYNATYIRIAKDSVSKNYTGYNKTDSLLSRYSTRLNNYAAFANFEFKPFEKLKVVTSVRIDAFTYDYKNQLNQSAYSGAPDSKNHFTRTSPKVGFTYNFSERSGLYFNYSEGFVPPQVTELYTGVKIPSLEPSVFFNYEAGGWIEIIKNKLFADYSGYILNGTNEVVNVKMENGSFANQNAGRTRHRGFELGFNTATIKNFQFRFGGAYSKHEFLEFVEKGNDYSGKEMNNAPRWIFNSEAWYKPSFLVGFRIGAELQYVGPYFTDPGNSHKYESYYLLNIRTGYRKSHIEVWVNLVNATNNYYSNITSKSNSGYSYQLADPVHVNMGLSYDFANLLKSTK